MRGSSRCYEHRRAKPICALASCTKARWQNSALCERHDNACEKLEAQMFDVFFGLSLSQLEDVLAELNRRELL